MKRKPSRQVTRAVRLLITVLAASLCIGCSARGPGTLSSDSFDYSDAIERSRSEQMLLNIVRLRYQQVPNFLTVSSIIAGYTYESEAGIRGQKAIGNFNEDTVGGSANYRYIERPTITYDPLQGAAFAQRMMRRFPVELLGALSQAGFPRKGMFQLAIERIGAIKNMTYSQTILGADLDHQQKNLARFNEMLNLVVTLEHAHSIELLRLSEDPVERPTLVFDESMPPALEDQAARLKDMLGLQQDIRRFSITERTTGVADDQLIVRTRSMLSMIAYAGFGVDIPARDATAQRVMATPDFLRALSDESRPIRVRSQLEKPDDPFVAIRFRDHWFYIDGTDQQSKSTFTVMLLLFELLAPIGDAAGPLLSIPTG